MSEVKGHFRMFVFAVHSFSVHTCGYDARRLHSLSRDRPAVYGSCRVFSVRIISTLSLENVHLECLEKVLRTLRAEKYQKKDLLVPYKVCMI